MNELEQVVDSRYFFKNNYTKGYAISLEPKLHHRSIKTGRIVVSHTQSGGKRTFQDIWKRDSDSRLRFVFRNPWDRPFADYDYIQDLESQILKLKGFAQELQAQLQDIS